jgi:hypothetical protein
LLRQRLAEQDELVEAALFCLRPIRYEHQNLLWQIRFAMWGFGLITSGTLLQIGALELELLEHRQ